MSIDIALPTYNCAAWLDALFESIVGQDFADWRIIARDDASKDNTAGVLIEWQRRLGKRLVILADSGKSNLGPVGNYDAVLSQTTAPWVMLADPDDIWLPDKVQSTVRAMHAAEQAAPETPIVVCSDATVVDDDLKIIAPSYWRWSRHNPDVFDVFHRLIVECPVLSSTMMVNRSLLDLALPMTGASCQDWWLALVAGAFGRIVRLPQSTILYRRHPANDSLDPLTSTLPTAPRRIFQARGRVKRLIRQFAPQADAFLSRFRDRVLPNDAAALGAAAMLPSLGPLRRRVAVLRHDLLFASPLKNAGLMLLL
jgi:glycosyltransferase involved in cell wall biosynthesis